LAVAVEMVDLERRSPRHRLAAVVAGMGAGAELGVEDERVLARPAGDGQRVVGQLDPRT
jgi:hypothetical protein